MEIHYKWLTPDMAGLLVDCVRAVYGERYSLPDFYHEEKIRDLLNQGLLNAKVAMNDAGEIIATLGIQLECVGAITADARVGMVRAEYRRSGVLESLGKQVSEIYAQLKTLGIQMYAVTFHSISQKKALASNSFLTGMLPAHLSKGTIADGFNEIDGRVGVVSMYYLLHKLPAADVYLPDIYEYAISNIFEKQAIERTVLVPAAVDTARATEYSSSFNENTFVLTAVVWAIGRDFESALTNIMSSASTCGSEVIYLDIPLSMAGCGIATEIANRQGFFFGALLLARKGGDRLRLQKLDLKSFNAGELKLYSEETKEFLEFVLKDARRVMPADKENVIPAFPK